MASWASVTRVTTMPGAGELVVDLVVAELGDLTCVRSRTRIAGLSLPV